MRFFMNELPNTLKQICKNLDLERKIFCGRYYVISRKTGEITLLNSIFERKKHGRNYAKNGSRYSS